MNDKWKTGFFLLLGIDLLIVILLFAVIMKPSVNQNKRINEPNNQMVSFYIKSNKKNLNQLINHYLKKEAEDSPIQYQIHLGNEVEFYGLIPFMGENLNMKLTFVPVTQKNGDLILKQRSISIGGLRLPVTYVLQFIQVNYKLPRGVDIYPNQKEIYIHTQQLKFKSDAKVKINKFNLKKDDIAFTLLVPVK